MTQTAQAEGRIVCEREGPVARLVIDNPDRRNAIDLAMWRQAMALLDQLAHDDAVRVLVVAGRGETAFASGADISKFERERNTAEEVARYHEASAGAYRRLKGFPKPAVASIGGFCIGGGLALALCCDIRICAEGSRFAVPAARLGLGYDIEGQRNLTEAVGAAVAADLLFSARQVDAAEALALGLVNRVVPAAERAAIVADYAAVIAANAPMTIALAKACKLALTPSVRPDEELRLQEMVTACYASADYKEGRLAFKEKRAPVFSGR
ncbi:enoyl-CoA hydratase [Xanthobacter sp. KR7-225]|uniref:enoyl-CoA hydratase n=1 Tax=Xanthobacter sp. KR7-225 TaxID=3156613 RepID=UPI0032B4B8A7